MDEIDEFMSLDEVVDYADDLEVMLCQRLDALLGENALLAAQDGTLATKLLPHMLDDDTLELLRGSLFIHEHLLDSEDVGELITALIQSLSAVAKYFRFCEMPIMDSWATDMLEQWIPDEIQALPETDFAGWVLSEGRKRGMTDEDIFSVIGHLCIGEEEHIVH